MVIKLSRLLFKEDVRFIASTMYMIKYMLDRIMAIAGYSICSLWFFRQFTIDRYIVGVLIALSFVGGLVGIIFFKKDKTFQKTFIMD